MEDILLTPFLYNSKEQKLIFVTFFEEKKAEQELGYVINALLRVSL